MSFPRSSGRGAGRRRRRHRTAPSLLEEGDKLADEGQFTEAVIRYKSGIEKLLPGLRKIPFKHEVKRDVTKRENMKDLILKEIDEDMTPQEFRANELAMKAFGLLPGDYNLREALAQVYAEEVAAFYDPKTKTMHLIEEPKKDARRSPACSSGSSARTSEFDKDENKTVIAHELTHALADQHYDLDAMQKAVKKDDDRSLALSALIEGEATLAMFGAGMDDWDGDEIINLPAENLEWTFNLISPFMPFMGGGKAIRNAPPIISESMIFPYFRGMVFCAKLTNKGGWAAIDEVYRDPPLSTEQILHPEKYRDEARLPDVDRPGRARRRAKAGRKSAATSWARCSSAILLKKHGGKAAAAGWDGDRYAVFEGPKGKLGLVWLSTWDSEDDAREFTARVRRLSERQGRQPGRAAQARCPTRSGATTATQLYVVQRHGSRRGRRRGIQPADDRRARERGSPGQEDRTEAGEPED